MIPSIYQEIADRLLDRLDYIRISPRSILVIGTTDSDQMIQKLQMRYPNATIFTEQKNQLVDMVVLCAPIVNQVLFYDAWRALNEEGLLLSVSLGPDTFLEIREMMNASNPFVDMHHLGDWMKQLHFSDPVVDRDEIIFAYDSAEKIASDFSADEIKSFFSCDTIDHITNQYEKYKIENDYPVTLEIVYGHAWKVALPEMNGDNEVLISVDAIRRR